MFESISFKNFKAWKDSGAIRLAPLTVLFGTNSAGKTSIPQLLLMLKQTVDSPDRKTALQLGNGRTLIDVGTYEDAVHGHDVSEPLEFRLDFTLDAPLRVRDPLSDRAVEGDALSFRATIVAEGRRPVVESFRYDLRARGEVALDLEMRRREGGARERASREFELVSSRHRLVRHSGRPEALPEPLRFHGFPDEVSAFYQNTAFTADFVLAFERAIRRVFHVGPLREYPKRLYLFSGEAPEHVGVKGDRAVEAILAGAERTYTWAPSQEPRSLPTLVAERLRSMGMIHSFSVEPLAEHRREYEVLVRTSPKLPEVKLTDVGFGVNQLLPVIVECFYVPRRSTVIFEQPEVHLHPRVQAELADLFVDAIRAREDGVPRECQYLVESHSEHFLRRLQRRIAEEELSKDDAALYFVHTDGGSARIEALDVDDYGNIRNWPADFFGDDMADLVARTEAQAKRMERRDLR